MLCSTHILATCLQRLLRIDKARSCRSYQCPQFVDQVCYDCVKKGNDVPSFTRTAQNFQLCAGARSPGPAKGWLSTSLHRWLASCATV
uniref:Uncharacterized protein n=1 Tax=Hyaloperonospora arabidopsidis (strain Emoy2) TaxID=559515 RepID=M4BFM0_HYAAE